MRVSARQQQQVEGDKLSNLIFHSSEEEDNVDEKIVQQRAINEKPLLMNSRPSLLQKSIMRSQQTEEQYIPIIFRRNNFVQERKSPPKDQVLLTFRAPPSILFIESDDEDEKPRQPQTQAQSPQQEQTQVRAASQPLPQIVPPIQTPPEQESSQVEDASICPPQPKPQIQHNQGNQGNQGNQDNQADNKPQERAEDEKENSVLRVSQSARQRGCYFQDILKRQQNYQAITGLMFEPLLPGTVQIFEVHVYSSLTEKSFELWMDSLPTMRLIMRAEKIVRPNRTTYEITTYLEHCKQFCQACSLSSNLDRSEFAIQTRKASNSLLLGTIACGTNIQNTKNIVLYYPTIDPQTLRPRALTTRSSLRLVYQDQQQRLVDYLSTTKLPNQERQRLMHEHSLRKSAKNMEFRGKDGDVRLMMGKKGTNRYCLIAGTPLTPIQVFSLAIVNIETS